MEQLLNFYKDQNRTQRQEIENLEKTIKRKNKEIYEVKQSIFKELAKVISIGQSNDIFKNMKMLKILNELKDDLYFDIQEYLEEQIEIEHKKELISDHQSQN